VGIKKLKIDEGSEADMRYVANEITKFIGK